MRKAIYTSALLFGAFVAAVAIPQVAPSTLPPNTVWGRLGISAGPGQAIPFSVLTSNLLSAGPLNDTSSVVGSQTAFFGGAASSTAQIHKLNVLLVGGATVMSRDGQHDQSPAPTTRDWLATLLPWTTPNAQIASLSGPGIWGMLGGSRSSDYRTWSGASNTGLTVGVGGFGINDDTNNNTAWGAYFQANRNSGAGPTWGVEIGLANFGTVPNVDPYTFFPTGYQAALLLESGAGYPQASDARTPTNASSALSIANNGAAFNKGIIFKSTALDTAVGGGGNGVAMELATGQSLRWLSAASATNAELWATSTGLTLSAGTAAFTPQFSIRNRAADATSPYLIFAKDRNGSAVQANDELGNFIAQGFANSALRNAAAITVLAAAPSGSVVPANIVLSTTKLSSLDTKFTFDSGAHLSTIQPTAPTVTAGCNGAGSSVTGGDMAGTVTGQTAAATTCTLTFGTAFAATPFCTVSGQNSPLTGAFTPSTTTLVVNFTSTGTYKWSYICLGS